MPGSTLVGLRLCILAFFFFFLKCGLGINLFIYLFIYFWLRWFFVAARGLSVVAASGGYSSLRCAGFSLRWLLLLRSMDSRCASFSSCGTRAVEHRLSSCGAQAYLLCGMWYLPGPGLKPVFPALAGGFLTTVPPGKSLYLGFLNLVLEFAVIKQLCVSEQVISPFWACMFLSVK